ncbi:hypothetical protein BDZ97DRAFT_1925401 [Flammula alnicola]|nr:hypothetical protein BDZ97DRAFT_1925401 [Flammula alnicola]
MPSPLYASLQPAWTFLSQKLIWFAITPETRHVSAASRTLFQLAIPMNNYMRELEATGSPEPLPCLRIRRWMWFLANAADEDVPPFARIDIFNVTQESLSVVGKFYPLYADWVSDAGVDCVPPYPHYVGMAQRLLDAEWISFPVVEATQVPPATVPEMDLDAMRLSPPPLPLFNPRWKPLRFPLVHGMDLGINEASLPPPSPLLGAHGHWRGAFIALPISCCTTREEDPEDRLRSLLEPPPRRPRGHKGKARARTPSLLPSLAPAPPLRAPFTRAAAARLAASSSVTPRLLETLDADPSVLADSAAAARLAVTCQQTALPGVASSSRVTLDVEPAAPPTLKRKVAALGDARSKRPRLEVAPDVPASNFAPSSKLLAEQFTLLLGNGPMTLTPPVCTACRLKGLEPEECVIPPLKDQIPNFEASVEVSQLSLTNLHNLFGRLHRTSTWNLVQREYVRQSELEMSALSREISSSLHHLVATDPDDSFQELYVEDNEAMAALVDVLSALAPGSLPCTDPHPDSRTSLSELASLLEGVPAPSWFPRPDHRFLPRAVPPPENVSDAGDVAGSVDTDTALAELDDLDEQVAILESLTSAK